MQLNSRTRKNAEPFPSIYFDNVFDEEKLNEILAEFSISAKDTTNYADDVQVKFGSRGERFFGEKTKAFMHYLNSEPFLNFLQELTGIEETLVNDPYFHGAGQHEIKPWFHPCGFNKHKTLGLTVALTSWSTSIKIGMKATADTLNCGKQI